MTTLAVNSGPLSERIWGLPGAPPRWRPWHTWEAPGGVQETKFEDVPARITSPARTIVDCFRFQRLVGREAALEAVQEALRDRKVTIAALTRTLEVLPSRRLSAILEAGVL